MQILGIQRTLNGQSNFNKKKILENLYVISKLTDLVYDIWTNTAEQRSETNTHMICQLERIIMLIHSARKWISLQGENFNLSYSLMPCLHVYEVASVVYDSLRPYGWDSPGKNTGVGCHALFQRIFPTQAFFTSEPLGKPSLTLYHIQKLILNE